MSDDELRAAAEMVVATGENKDWYDTIDAGALAVCRSWLAGHPADSDTLVDEAWLRSVGFEQLGSFELMVIKPGKSGFRIGWWLGNFGNGIEPHITINYPGYGGGNGSDFKTRGDVRRLAKCLGIELKGGGE